MSDSEEEILVYAELEDGIDIDKYKAIHILGINEKCPVIQMDDSFFTGKYENAMGTYMFFKKDLTASTSDPVFDQLPEKNLKYLCKTRKYLKMAHSYVAPKEGTEISCKNEGNQADDQIKPPEFKSVQEAIEAFKNEWSSKTSEDISETPQDV